MTDLRDSPIFVFLFSFLILWLSAQAGVYLRKKSRTVEEEERTDWGTVIASTLTLLGLIIAFSFSMAISRYDQRKQREAQEANAIGTEYVRAGLLSASDAEKVQNSLKEYVHQRILFYQTQNSSQLHQIDGDTTQLENSLWSVAQSASRVQPTPPIALVAAGMNDVLNARGYTQAAWWNRIPAAAWSLMFGIAVLCNLLFGYAAHRDGILLLLVLPLALSISFFLIADIDSPRGGVIRITPHNLLSLSDSLNRQ